MSEIETLRNSLTQYELQLSQVDAAISAANRNDVGPLLNLQKDLKELIDLTQQNLNGLDHGQEPDPLKDEYAQFMAEMGQLETDIGNATTPGNMEGDVNISTELKSLVGMKCSAYYTLPWGGKEKHNAMVCEVTPPSSEQLFDDIQVRIMYTNPTYKEMVPCPFYLEGSCKFDETKCHFSHGELVLLSSLSDHSDPDFTRVKPGIRVLVKQLDKIWHRGTVIKLGSGGEGKDKTCSVLLDVDKKKCDVQLCDVLPLHEDDHSVSEDSDNDCDIETNLVNKQSQRSQAYFVQRSLLNQPSKQVLGDWEKHTKGIGSKLMESMGYVIGCGLGKQGEGRLDPVDAVALPPGKSLDHCMRLREEAAGDENLFSVEKRLKRLQKKQEQQNQKAYERSKQRGTSSVFNFINDQIFLSVNNSSEDSSSGVKNQSAEKERLRASSSKGLNVANFKIHEDILKIEKEVSKCKDALKRHSEDSLVYNQIKAKLDGKNIELNNLRISERRVLNEQKLRKDKHKLTIF